MTGYSLAELRTTTKMYEWAAKKASVRSEPGAAIVVPYLKRWAEEIRGYIAENMDELAAKEDELYATQTVSD